MPDGSGLLVDVSLSTKKLEADADRIVARITKSGQKIDAAWLNATKGIDTSFKKAGASASVFEREIAKTDRQVENLRKSVDPLYAATKRLEGQEKLLNRALRSGQIDLQVYEGTLELVRAEYNLATTSAQRFAASGKAVSSGLGGARGQIQNVAFQVGDFATQVGAGTSASQALGQQLPQLLGGFGALGAVLGAVAAIGVPLGAALLRAGDDAGEAKDAMAALATSVNAYTTAAQNTLVPTEELAAKYGRATTAAETFARALRDIAEVQATEAISASINDLVSNVFGDSASYATQFANIDELNARFAQLVNQINDAGISDALRFELQAEIDQLNQVRLGVSSLSSELDISAVEAIRLSNAIEELGQAQGPLAQAEAARVLQGVLVDVFGEYENMTEQARALFDQTAEIGNAASEVQGALQSVNVEFSSMVGLVSDVASGLGVATAQADSLANSAARAAQNIFAAAQNLATARSAAIARGPDGAVNDIRDSLTPSGLSRDDIVSQITIPARTSTTTARTGGSRGGGGSAVSKVDQEAQQELTRLQQEGARVVSDLQTDTERYQAEMQRLVEIQQAGAITTGQLSAAQSNLTAEFQQARFDDLGLGDFVDSLADAIANSENLGDVFIAQINRMASSLISSGLNSLAQNLFASAFPIGGASGGSAFPSFDGGGFTGPGARIGGVDGKGGFGAILHPNETVVDNTRSGSSGGSGGAPVYNIDARGAQMGVADQIAQAMRANDARLPSRTRQLRSDRYRDY